MSCDHHVIIIFRVEIETELRVNVDELMREELNNLKLVMKDVNLYVYVLTV